MWRLGFIDRSRFRDLRLADESALPAPLRQCLASSSASSCAGNRLAKAASPSLVCILCKRDVLWDVPDGLSPATSMTQRRQPMQMRVQAYPHFLFCRGEVLQLDLRRMQHSARGEWIASRVRSRTELAKQHLHSAKYFAAARVVRARLWWRRCFARRLADWPLRSAAYLDPAKAARATPRSAFADPHRARSTRHRRIEVPS